MRRPALLVSMLIATFLSACGFWPRELALLAESMSEQTSGEASAWLVGGDVVVIDIAGSPLYEGPLTELETVATELAAQAIGSVTVPLESLSVTFHEHGVSEDPGKMHQFIFLVEDRRPRLLTDLAP